MFNWLVGENSKKSIITGSILGIFNFLRLIGVDPGIDVEKFADSINYILVGIGIISLRLGIGKRR